MQKPSIRYLMTAIAIIAACLGFWQSPIGVAVNDDGASGVPYRHMIDFRPLGFYMAVSALMHVCTTLLGIGTLLRWVSSVLVPTFAVFLYHFMNAKKISPLSVNLAMDPQVVFLVNLATFTGCFLIVSGFFYLCRSIARKFDTNR